MNANEISLVRRLAKQPTTLFPKSFPDAKKIAILDAAADLVEIRHSADLRVDNQASEGAKLKYELLARRAEIPVASDTLQVNEPFYEAPHQGHRSRRLAIGGGYSDTRGGFNTLRLRLTMHDLADPSTGYPATSQLEFLSTVGRFWFSDGNFRLEDFALVRARALSPLGRLDKPISWRFATGARRVVDRGCDDCLIGYAEVGGGLTLATRGRGLTLFATTDLVVGGGPDLDGAFDTAMRLELGPSGGLRVQFAQNLIALIEGNFYWLPEQPANTNWSGQGTLRWGVTTNQAINLEYEIRRGEAEGRGSFMIYF